MKRLLLTLILILSAAVAVNAQQKGGRHQDKRPSPEEVLDFKMKFLAQEMELDQEQQQKFFDLYKKMSSERFSRYRKIKELKKKLKSSSSPSDEDYAALSEAINQSRVADAEMEKRYDAQFAKFLSAKQIFKLKESEEKFRRKMNEMKGGRRPNK